MFGFLQRALLSALLRHFDLGSLAGRGLGSAPSTRRVSTGTHPTAVEACEPHSVGMALTSLVWLARCTGDRSAKNCHRVAPAKVLRSRVGSLRLSGVVHRIQKFKDRNGFEFSGSTLRA
jgi:hypothetical protein